ncbi:hypothetical protein GCM10011529_31350 [Polymorphobacter glacialis]|uniref:Uncharacterized protein n=1 Tax=Sandarakinorhabdus glacialis TaxID=1614636 RepID=A0A917A3U8_9SPHN|nr:hypothetical protein [Polymorphobacter glacialis]GGE22496.1 hypothetical protein GCM10011529_31350 [Polymorphobacter glacialis]
MLSALRQNPHIHAAMTSLVANLVTTLLRGMSQENEGAVFIDNDQRERVLKAAGEAFYADFTRTSWNAARSQQNESNY